MTDSLLRGMGFAGAAVSTVKNAIIKIAEGKKAQDAAPARGGAQERARDQARGQARGGAQARREGRGRHGGFHRSDDGETEE